MKTFNEMSIGDKIAVYKNGQFKEFLTLVSTLKTLFIFEDDEKFKVFNLNIKNITDKTEHKFINRLDNEIKIIIKNY